MLPFAFNISSIYKTNINKCCWYAKSKMTFKKACRKAGFVDEAWRRASIVNWGHGMPCILEYSGKIWHGLEGIMWYSKNPLENIFIFFFQIELFKKAGWTVIQPPVPLIPDGIVTLPFPRIPRVLLRVLIRSNTGTAQGFFSCFRSPSLDVF